MPVLQCSFENKIEEQEIMGKRITVVLDDDLLKKLRFLQAKRIKETASTVSFSRIVNETLEKGLK